MQIKRASKMAFTTEKQRNVGKAVWFLWTLSIIESNRLSGSSMVERSPRTLTPGIRVHQFFSSSSSLICFFSFSAATPTLSTMWL